MLKRIFVDSNDQRNSCLLVSDLGRPIHGTLVLFRIGANLERPEHGWSELTATQQPVWRKTGSTFVYTLSVRCGEECSGIAQEVVTSIESVAKF